MAAGRFDLGWREGTYTEFSAFCADADVGCAGKVDCEAKGVAVEDYDDGFYPPIAVLAYLRMRMGFADSNLSGDFV